MIESDSLPIEPVGTIGVCESKVVRVESWVQYTMTVIDHVRARVGQQCLQVRGVRRRSTTVCDNNSGFACAPNDWAVEALPRLLLEATDALAAVLMD